MTGHSLTLTEDSSAPPEAVWAVLTDLDAAGTTLSGVTRIERLTDGPYGVGTRWRESRSMLGKEETQEMWVAEAIAPVRTVIKAGARGVDYTTSFVVAPTPAGSTLTMTFGAEHVGANPVQRLVWRAFGRLGLRMTAKIMRQDLADIVDAAERR